MEDIAIRESEQIDIVARNYIEKGYEVQKLAELDFMPGFRVDLLARKGGETKVVEVKAASTLAKELRNGTKIDELNEKVALKDGWSLVLHLVPELERLQSPIGAEPFDREDVALRIAEAERALKAGFPEAAILLAWSAAESAARISLAVEGIAIKRITSSGYTIGRAVSEGALSLENVRYLDEAEKHRNAIVHGFKGVDIDGERLVSGLIETARRILKEADEWEPLAIKETIGGPEP